MQSKHARAKLTAWQRGSALRPRALLLLVLWQLALLLAALRTESRQASPGPGRHSLLLQLLLLELAGAGGAFAQRGPRAEQGLLVH
jgi:hypothetical protein